MTLYILEFKFNFIIKKGKIPVKYKEAILENHMVVFKWHYMF